MNDIRQFVEQIIGGSKEAPTGSYYPTLVVGLGGTGLRVLRNLKKRLAQSNVNQVQLLGIDSDSGENEKWPDLPPLAEKELIILNQAVAVSSLDRAASGQASDAHVLEFLPDEHEQWKGLHQDVRARITSQKGAGQFRRAGKLLFCANVSEGANINARFQAVKDGLTGMPATMARLNQGYVIAGSVRIYVVCSIAGGTGAGAIIECMALLRKFFNDPNDKITAILMLSGPLFDRVCYDPPLEKAQTRGNVIGVLRELQPFLVRGMGRHRFIFDSRNTFQLGTSKLVDDVYLVDHQNADGNLSKDNMDVYLGISQFLYSLVGSGVGASQAAGMINGQIQIDHQAQAIPLVYNAFGIGSVEYPMDGLLMYSARSAINVWLSEWLTSEKQKSQVEAFVVGLGLRELDDLRTKLSSDIEEAKLTDDWKRNVMKEADDQFLDRTRRRRVNLKEELNARQNTFEKNAAALTPDVKHELEYKILEWLASGKLVADAGLKGLKKHLDDLAEKRLSLAKKREADEKQLSSKLQRKERWINLIDLGLDTKLRKEYLTLTEQAMESAVAYHLDPLVAEVISNLQAAVKEFEAKLGALGTQMESFYKINRQAIASIEAATCDSCFVQPVLAPSKYSEWVTENRILITAIGIPKSISQEALLNAALESIIPGYERLVGGFSIRALAVSKRNVKNAVCATNTSSQPLMRLVSTAPSRANMVPQKFVAGDFANNVDPFIAEHFQQVGTRAVEGLPTGDKHRMLCVQTISGFGAVHWSGFDVAEAYYREKPWRYHSFASMEGLPSLRPLSEDQSVSLKYFGLGLAFELITSRGANYYQNVKHHEAEDTNYFLLYKADPNNGASQLMDASLIKPADKDRVKPKKSDLLGGSLEDAVAKFREPQTAPFLALLDDIIEAFIAYKGKAEIPVMLESYITEELGNLISIAGDGTPRRKILEDIREALRIYAVQLH